MKLRFFPILLALLASSQAWPDARTGSDVQVANRVAFAPELNSRLPSLYFKTAGDEVSLRSLLSRRPTLLTFTWFDCANLCGLILNGLADASGALLSAEERDFQVIAVSLDASAHQSESAAITRSLNQRYPGSDIEGRWYFLTGTREAIHRLADAVGYHFSYDVNKQQFAHAAGVVSVSRDGYLRSYRSGINYQANDIRQLLDAAENGASLGSKPNPVLMLCYDYDPASGRYSLAIMKLLRVLAVLSLLALAVAVLYWQRGTARRRS